MSQKIVKEGLKNSVYMLLSQTVNLILGIIRSVLLPIMLGVVSYGYWQVYILFLSFSGSFTLGVSDGIYLRYGRYEYDDIPRKKFRITILLFVGMQMLFVCLLTVLARFENTENRRIAIQWAIINIPILGLTGVLSCILQATNQIKKFSLYALIDKMLVLLLVIAILLLKFDNYIYIIYADTFARFFALCLMIYSCREVIFGKLGSLKTGMKELWSNLSVGIKVMLSSLTGTFILTFGVLYVEINKPIEIYSVYSFSTSTMALVLILVSALGTVIYPTLARIEEKKYPRYYLEMNKILNVFIYFVIIIYFPLTIFIKIFMHKYTGLFPYLPIVFGIIIIQSKMQILINPYYKLLREESRMFSSNITGMIISMILVVASFQIFKSEIVVAGATFIAMLYRLLTMEHYLFEKMKIKRLVINIDVFFIFYFIFTAYISPLWLSFLVYFLGFTIYAYYKLVYVKNKNKISPNKFLEASRK